MPLLVSASLFCLQDTKTLLQAFLPAKVEENSSSPLSPWRIKDEKGNEKANDKLKQDTRWRLLTVGVKAF